MPESQEVNLLHVKPIDNDAAVASSSVLNFIPIQNNNFNNNDTVTTPTSISMNSFNMVIDGHNRRMNCDETSLSILNEFKLQNNLDKDLNNNNNNNNVNSILENEINRLRKYAYYLETENLRLSLKIDKTAKANSTTNNNTSLGVQETSSNNSNNLLTTGAAVNPFEMELRVRKAVPESDSDEYKV
jgi:hypothetical protein